MFFLLVIVLKPKTRALKISKEKFKNKFHDQWAGNTFAGNVIDIKKKEIYDERIVSMKY